MILQKDIDGKLVLSDEQINKTVQKIINKKKKHKTMTFTMFINGKEVTVVKYRELIDLDKYSPSSRRKITKRYIVKAFEESAVMTIDGKLITVKSMGGARKMTFKVKQKYAFFLEELIQNAKPSKRGPDYYDNRVLWFYYDSYIQIDDKVIYVLVNLKEVGGTTNFYDINKIKEVDMSATLNE